MARSLRSLALANLTVVLLLLIWPEGFQFLFIMYLLINTVALLIIAGQISEIQEKLTTTHIQLAVDIDRLKEKKRANENYARVAAGESSKHSNRFEEFIESH